MNRRDIVILILCLPVFSIVSTGIGSLIVDGDLHPLSPFTFVCGCVSAVCIVIYAFAAWTGRRDQ